MKIGVDIGGTEIKAGIVSNNKILRKIVVKTGSNKKEIIKNMLDCVEVLFDKKIEGIGIGSPGPADYSKGVLGDTPNMPLKGVNLKKIVFNKFRKKVVMDNDANCFVLGEAARLKKKNVVGLTLGTGVGGGIVINGELYRGRGNAGELGHCTIKFDGKKLGFNQGSLESYVSAKAIKRDYGKGPLDLKSSKAWKEIGEKLGVGVANLINSFDPDVVVIGGGIAKGFSKFKAGMNKEIMKRVVRKVPVVKGKEDSGILGAACLF
ncbi:ROK family protein [Candidatus Woesearchaeota archaeon]|nr:ROK family protein [Candidatus Woesearchaeota archaeon]